MAALILGLGWYGLKFFARASPVIVARTVRYAGGAAAGLVGLLLLFRGRVDLGMAGIGVGLWLAGFAKLPSFGPFQWAARRATGRSRVRSAMLDMELDQASGTLDGSVTSGPHAGRPLETFTRPECEDLYRDCLRDDPKGARLLEAYLDRRFPGWGQTGQSQRDAGRGEPGQRRNAGLTEQQAYEILGLRQGSTRDDVVRAHRTLMKEAHPDYGGATEDAARINEAREVLMRRLE